MSLKIKEGASAFRLRHLLGSLAILSVSLREVGAGKNLNSPNFRNHGSNTWKILPGPEPLLG